jgi:hypothetical protein
MNYLAKQAARTLALAPGVRPRIAPRFDAAAFEPMAVEETVPRQEPAPSAPPRELPRTVIVENVLRGESERVQTLVERVMPRQEPPRVREEIVETRIVPRIDTPQPQDRPRAVEPRLDAHPLPRRNVRAPEEPPQPRTIVDERIVRMIERTETTTNVTRAETDAGAIRAPSADVRPIAEPPRALSRKVAAPTRAIERAPQVAAHESVAPPAIHVTIGRVDVRAVMTSEPPAKPAPVAMQPSLSLDDYLKQREGRSR